MGSGWSTGIQSTERRKGVTDPPARAFGRQEVKREPVSRATAERRPSVRVAGGPALLPHWTLQRSAPGPAHTNRFGVWGLVQGSQGDERGRRADLIELAGRAAGIAQRSPGIRAPAGQASRYSSGSDWAAAGLQLPVAGSLPLPAAVPTEGQ